MTVYVDGLFTAMPQGDTSPAQQAWHNGADGRRVIRYSCCWGAVMIHTWTSERRASYQHPSGKYKHKHLRPHLSRMRSAGLTFKQIAKQTGISEAVWRNVQTKDGPFPLGRIIVSQLAREVGVTVQGLRGYIERQGISTARFGRKVTLTLADAQRITAHYAAFIPQQASPDEWWSMARLARFFTCSPAAMALRLTRSPFNSIRHNRIAGQLCNAHRYSAADAQRVRNAMPLAVSSAPAGTLSSQELAALLGVRRSVVTAHAQRGCPHVRVRRGSGVSPRFRLSEVYLWFLAQSHPAYRLHAERLQPHLGRAVA